MQRSYTGRVLFFLLPRCASSVQELCNRTFYVTKYVVHLRGYRGGSWRGQTPRSKGHIDVSTSKKDREADRAVRGGRRRSRLDEPQAAACCPDRYNPLDVHAHEQQQHHQTTARVQQRQPHHPKEISFIGSKKGTTGEVRNEDCSPTPPFGKQKLERLSQRQRNSIFTIVRAKLSSFVNRLSVSSGAGCAATRILTSTSSSTTAGNSDLSSVISFPLRQNSQQKAVQTDSHPATTTMSVVAPALSSVQANASLSATTVLSNPSISKSWYGIGGVQNELQFVKFPVTTALHYQYNDSSDLHGGGVYLHHLQKQKPATSSTSCGLFQQSTYPAAVHLADGENGCLGMERLVPKEENERWIRAPPNCNPFDMRASFTCSSLSCRARVTQATYGRSRLNTVTGIERPAAGGGTITVGGNKCRGRKCTEQVRSNDSLLTDCRQHEDGCFSPHLRWLSMKEFSENHSKFDARPVVYVPVLYETVCDTNIHRAITNSVTSDGSNSHINKPSPSPSSSSSLLHQIPTSTFPTLSTCESANNVDSVASGCTSIPVNYSTNIVTHRTLNAKFDSPAEEEEKEKVEKLRDEIITGLSSQLVLLLFV
ncbi:unnamed protein product [Litomosoides sigmodontis]|uniref:Uncharacterized protein n=1 Tax=Litomosoides sigmodontis TaxID=42156 RepID=A0A3P6TLC7_LITSI|nr:unnamed protein product [Litomosoides sigmodontis]